MLEELAPATRLLRKVKILAANPGSIDDRLSVNSKISFQPFINYLKDKSKASSGTRSRFYKYLLEKFEPGSDPSQPLIDPSPDSKEDLLELLNTTLFPLISEQEKNAFALAVPYQFALFDYTPSFGKLFVDPEKEHFLLPEGVSMEHMRHVQCSLVYEHVLDKFYGIKLNDNAGLIYPVVDRESGMRRYYRLRIDRRFIDIHLEGQLPLIQDCAVCLNTFRILDLERQLRTMPLSLFSMEGFAVWIAEDVTAEESLDAIKKALLRHGGCDAGIIDELKMNIQALVGMNNVEVGLTPFVKLNNRFILDETCTRHGLIGNRWRASDENSERAYRACMDFLTEHPEPIPVCMVDEQVLDNAPMLREMWTDGVRSYIVCPIQNDDGLLGILEIASSVPNQLNQDIMRRIEPAMPLLSVALLKNRDAFNARVEKLIKEKFTALQPSVEWKFAEVAWEYMQNPDTEGPDCVSGNVAFDDVYPLYGAIDIRNSSVERSQAIRKDLEVQLDFIDLTLDHLQTQLQLPLLESLKFKTHNLLQVISKELLADDEVRIHDFFEKELHPVLRHLQKSNEDVQTVIEGYNQLADDTAGYFYRFRNEYEQTMTTINNVVLHHFEQAEETMQRSYPHYYEKFKTDGVEYTIYIGQSITPDRQFDLLYLKNIRLWQIRSMAEIAGITHKLTPSLPVALQTTQLILIHSHPISISFRRDERRFDVEGSRNIRYEVMKKRLDKVRIQGTGERLTQPGKIAMVYSNPKEAEEYQEYILFLQSKRLLSPGVECLELEELQGVSGLKALRVSVNLEAP
ncbi:GAF domain-containing protein [Puia sp.]|jgi:hypothetical protein|uniref:GAF domain-containing protein n=1 Tax=Puia sp. TaxID=2045100 RepID=UPI002F401572